MDPVSASPPVIPHHTRSRTSSRTRLSMERKRNYAAGIALLLGVVVLWTSSNFLTQGLYEDGYEKPFLVTYLNTSAFAFYLIPYAIRKSYEKSGSPSAGPSTGGHEGYHAIPTEADAAETLNPSHDARAGNHAPPLTTQETARLAAEFCFLWFIANWTVNAALGYTSVASATILSSTSGFFTLCIGRLVRVESLTLVKICTVITSFVGVVLVSISDSAQPDPLPSTTAVSHRPSLPLLGDTLALLSALFYACYVSLLKVRIRDESRIDMQLFFGFVGVFNIVACWPIGVVLHLAGVEPFAWPSTSKAVVALLINMGITLSSDFMYVLAMLKTTPLVVTVGLSLTMPLAVVGDSILGRPSQAQVIVGAAIVVLSFVALGVEDSRNEMEADLLVGAPLDPGAERVGTLRLSGDRGRSE